MPNQNYFSKLLCYSYNFDISKLLKNMKASHLTFICSYLIKRKKPRDSLVDKIIFKQNPIFLEALSGNLKALFLAIRVNILSVTSSKMQLQWAPNNSELPARGCIQNCFHRPVSKFTSCKRTAEQNLINLFSSSKIMVENLG